MIGAPYRFLQLGLSSEVMDFLVGFGSMFASALSSTGVLEL